MKIMIIRVKSRMKILLFILILLIIVAAIILLRAVLLKPTSAKEAKVTLDTSERSILYGQQLSKMVQKETISFRGQTDISKRNNLKPF